MSNTVERLDPQRPKSSDYHQAHHIGNPPNSFRNPWPSFNGPTRFQLFRSRFLPNSQKKFVPVPANRSLLVQVRRPNFESDQHGLRATWFGHASFLVETSIGVGMERGVRILCDPVWSEKVGPYGMIGPDRFTEVPCAVEELPEVDAVLISHDHYDHLDSATLAKLVARQPNIHFFCGLNLKAVLIGLGIGIREEQVVEMDWWDRVVVKGKSFEEVELICTPAQHSSGRGPFGPGAFGKTLWCSWIVRERPMQQEEKGKKLFFAGDTGYCAVNSDTQLSHTDAPHPPCPAFKDIGDLFGPFDLALLPIGCNNPRSIMSGVHSSPEDSISIHKDVQSQKSIGMHYGTFRGSVSAHFEPVTQPPERWKAAAQREGLSWRSGNNQDWEIGLCEIGETIIA